MKWLAILATEEDLRAALEGRSGIVVAEEGGAKDLGTFLERATSWEKPWAMVWLRGDSIPAQGGPSGLDIASDERLMAALVDIVTSQVASRGGALLDLQEFRLTAEAAREVAQRAGLDVSIGLKAVFTPREAAASESDHLVTGL